MADDTSASSPAGVEKKSPIGKMLSRSGSFFSRAPRSTPAQTPDTSERPRSLSPPNSRSGSIRGQSFDAALIETAFDTLPPLGEYSSLLADEAAGADQLKALLKRTMESIGLLKDKCIEVEENYKTALVKATSEYQQSVNELFSMEQKIQSEDSVEGLELKLRHMKERTVKIDKERRTAVARVEDLERLNQRQEMELKDLREVTGGSMDDIRMWAVDAKLTRALMTELGTQKLRIESLELELNHDKNHFAEMSAVFDSKSKDFKTRMETLEKQHTEMTRELTKAEREVAVNYEEMNSYKTALSRTNDRMRQLLETTVTKMEYDEELQRRKVAEMKVENEMAIRKNLEKQLEDTHHKFVKHIDELQAEVETSSITIKEANWKKEAFEKKYNSQTAELNRLSESEKALLLRVQTLEEERSTSLSTYIEKIADLEQERALLNNKYEFDTAALCGSIKHVEMLVERQQSEIVSLHNTIDELKGNIRVFARIRPLLSDETALGQTEPAVVPLSGGYSLRIGKTGRNPAMLDTFMPDDPECTRTFSYDKVFPPTISQSEVFEQVIEYVKATMEGHATCLMSYGQTGSGKTYSMQGPAVKIEDEARGIIPRAMEEIARQIDIGRAFGWSYTVKVSFIQIYLENVQDLLREKDDDVKHEIKKVGNGVIVTDVNMISLDPSDANQVAKIMSKAARMRNVAVTGQNAESSRSHAIFTLFIHGVNKTTSQELDGTMYLVDLAGSERLSKSQASGDTLKETQFINKSLSALGDVFMAIAQKSSHIPYRNSKLTYLLQSALSGFHKTLMIVHLSPAEESYGESICTIRFASQVNSYSATSSLRSMSLSLGDQAPSVNSRSPSFTKAEAKSPKNLNIGTLRSNSYVGGGGKETPTRSGSAGIAQSPKASLLDESFGSPETVGSDPTSTPSKRVRGIAKVFTFDFDDENSVMEASPSRLLNDSSQSLGVDIMDVANQAESDHIEVPMPPSSSPSVLKKNSAAVTSPPAPITSKRGGYMSMTKSAAPGSDANSPEKVLLRKSSSNLSRTGSTGSEVKKSTTIRQTTRSASALPPPSPKTSSPIKRSVTSVTPSPAAKSATSKSKSTF